MKEFHRREAEARKKERLLRKHPTDAEGWTTVIKKGKSSLFSTSQAAKLEDNVLRAKQEEELGRQSAEHGVQKDFYSFQLAALKAKRINVLARRFLNKKKRIEALKSNRKFTPY
eukprot:EG_transcript_35947